jgi:thioredoxin reductase
MLLQFDLIIVGAGPAGLAAAIRAKELGLKYLVIEKGRETLSGITEFYPRGKKIYPTVPKGERGDYLIQNLKPPEEKVVIEEYLARVRSGLEELGGLVLRTQEEFLGFKKIGDAIEVTTSAGKYVAKNLVLAIGSNIPRELEVYGEAKPVARTLHKPEKYLGHHVLVIGGGNTGADVVISLSRLKRERGDDTKIYWAHRREKFKVDREVARDLGEEILLGGNIRILRGARPVIGEVDETGIRRLTIRTQEHRLGDEIKFHQGMSFPMKNVIACIGFCGPAPIFEGLGLELMRQARKGRGTELIVLDENYQTSVKGVYAIGGAISPSYIKRSQDGKHHEEVRHPNLIFTAVRDGATVAEHIKTLY